MLRLKTSHSTDLDGCAIWADCRLNGRMGAGIPGIRLWSARHVGLPATKGLRAIAAAIFVSTCVPALGQNIAPGQSLYSPGISSSVGTASAAFSNRDSATGVITDVFMGTGSTGPFVLSYSQPQVGSQLVVVNGRLLVEGNDYNVNYTTGQISLAQPLPTGSLLRVTYKSFGGKQQNTGIPSAVPLQWQLAGNQHGWLRLNSMLQRNTSGGGLPAVQTDLQLHGITALGSASQLTAGMFVDLHGGNWLRRSGVVLGDKSAWKGGDFALQLNRAGTQFNQSDVAGISAGQQNMQAALNLQPLKQLSFSLNAQDFQQLGAPTSGRGSSDVVSSTREQFSGGMNLQLGGGTHVQGQRNVSTTAPAGGKSETVVQDNVNLVQQLPGHTTATAAYAATNASGAAGNTYSQSSSLSLTSQPTAQMQLHGVFENVVGSTPQNQESLAVGYTPVAKIPGLNLNLSDSEQFMQTGVVATRAFNVNAPLLHNRVKLAAGVNQFLSPGQSLYGSSVSASAQINRAVSLQGDMQLRWQQLTSSASSGTMPTVNTYGVNLAVQPIQNVKLTGGFTRNPVTNGQVVRALQENVGLNATVGALSLNTNVSMQDLYNGAASDVDSFSLSLKLSPYDSLQTGLQANNLFGGLSGGQQTYQLGFTHSLGNIFDFSLAATLTVHNGMGQLNNQPDYGAQAQLGLHF